jgi:hypothetical protein
MKDTPKQAEVDVGRLFKIIENILISLKSYLIKLFNSILYVILYLFLFIKKYIKILIVIIIVGASLGYALDKYLDKEYHSYMMVQPNYNSVYQLYSNIEYYNGLIGEADHTELSSIFEISESEAKSLIKFDIKPGPNNKNENLLLYDNFIKNADSITVSLTSYEIFTKEQDKYIRSRHLISVNSKDKGLYKSIEKGIVNGISDNAYLNEQLNNEIEAFVNKEKDLNMMINRLDSINNLYQKVINEEAGKSSSAATNIDLGGAQNDKTKELQLLDKKSTYLDQIRDIQRQKSEKNKFINVISGFYEQGIIQPNIFKRKMVLIPLILMGLFLLFIIIRDTDAYVEKTHKKLKKNSLLSNE